MIAAAAGFIALQAACVALARGHSYWLSPFLIVPPLLASAACFWRGRHAVDRARLLWTLTSLGLLVWSVGAVMATREEFFLHTPDNLAAGSQIVFFMYGIPVLLAIALQAEGSISSPLIWLDGIQIAITGFLIYLELFNVAPFLSAPANPGSIAMVVLTFNVENIVLAVAATLRALSGTPREETHRFYRSFAVFLWTYAAASALYNYITVRAAGTDGLDGTLVTAPFLMLCIFALHDAEDATSTKVKRSERAATLSLMLDNASPAIFPASVLALGIAIARHHFVSGTASIAVSVLVYSVRSTLLQIQYRRAQAEASEARDRMEIISLTDPLTGIPNRRHFDRVFLAEWNRLSRQPGPLSLLLIDIDHFKFLNDEFGHGEGDICLRQVAHVLQASLRRESDTMTRFGGEEFAAVLPNTDAPGAEAVALRMAATLRSMRLRTKSPMGDAVTISIGRSTCELPTGFTQEDLFDTCDRALYQAKQNGRDRTEFLPMQTSK